MPALKKYGDARPALVTYSPNSRARCAAANRIKSRLKSVICPPAIMLRVITLNLNGVRSAVAKGWLQWLAKQHADVVCMQELKAHETDLSAEMRNPANLSG